MRFLRTVLLLLVAFGACGCYIRVPDPPDITIHGEINTGDDTGDDTGEANGANGQADPDRDG